MNWRKQLKRTGDDALVYNWERLLNIGSFVLHVPRVLEHGDYITFIHYESPYDAYINFAMMLSPTLSTILIYPV